MSASPYFSGPSRKSRFGKRSGTQPVFSLPGAPVHEHNAPEEAAGQPGTTAGAADAAEPEDKPSNVARPRLPTVQTNYGYASPPKHRLRQALFALALLGGGIAAGYFIGIFSQAGSQAKKPTRAFDTIETVDKPPALTMDERTQLDTAFSDGRARKYKEAEQLLTPWCKSAPR